jgi:hypothetical protein
MTLRDEMVAVCAAPAADYIMCRFPQVYIDGEFFGGCDIMIGERDSQACQTRCAASVCITPDTTSPA